MGKLTDKQKDFLKKHNLWNPEKGKSKLGLFEEGNFKDFFRRKEQVEQDLARLPDEEKKRSLTLRLQAAEDKAKNKKFKEAYKDLERVKEEAREAADNYVNALSPGTLGQEIGAWREQGENLDKLLTQLDSGVKTAKGELAAVGKPAPFASSAAADQFLQGLQTSENRLRSQIDGVKDACTKVESYLGKNDVGAKLQSFGHQLSMLRKERNVDTADLDLRVESAHVYFIHGGKTAKAGEFQPGVNELAAEIEKTLAERKKAGTFQANQVYWKERSVTVGDRMLEVLKTGPVERTRIEALWAMANDRAEKGGEADLAAAVTMLGDLKSLLETATPEVKEAEGGLAGIEEKRKLHAAQVLLGVSVDAARVALQRLRAEFQPTLPTALNVQVQKLDGLVAPSTETDPVKIENLAKSVAAETLKLDELAVTPRTERATWVQNLSAFEVQLGLLTSHSLHDDPTTILPLIDGIKNDLAQAKLKAGETKWAEATSAVKLLVPRCESAMQTADGLAHYETIYQDRKDRVDTLPDPGTITQDQPKKAVEAAVKLLADAKTEKDTGKYPASITLLNQIPAAVERAKALVEAATNYDASIGDYETAVANLGNFTGDAATAIQAGLVQLRDRLDKARIAVTNDYATSNILLNQTTDQVLSLRAKAQQAVAYKDALAAFELRFTAVEDHEGRIAIEDFYVRLQNDRTFANTRKLAGEFHIGTTILDASKPLQAAQLALANKGKDYKEKHKKAKEDLAALQLKGNKGQAAEALAEAQRRITAAENAATAKDWDGALKMIADAAVSITTATKILADDQALANLKDAGKLDAIATDFNAAFGVYQAMRGQVTGKDTGRVFATRLATADAPAQRAQNAARLSAPNFVLARSELNAAITICERTLLLVSKKVPYDTALAAVKTAHTTTLPGLNEDNCISPKITEIGLAITDAENAAQAEAYNFDSAQQKIGATLVKVRDAERAANAYKSMKADKQTIADTLTFLKAPVRSAGLAPEIKRLEDAQTSIANDVTAGKFAEAVTTASTTAKACPVLKKVAETYENVKNLRKTWVTDKLPEIEGAGKEAAAPEVAEVKGIDAEIEKSLNSHVYGVVRDLVVDAWSAIKAGKLIVTAAEEFETLRKDVDKKLNDTLPDRNPATEECYDALRERYEAAVQLAASERNYTRAKNMLTPISGECDALHDDAEDYRKYETARQKAGKKLGDAMKDKQAEAVRPLLTQLQGRHAEAVKIANGGDYQEATKLLDLVFAGAEKALASATESREYAAAAEDARKPGTAINVLIAKAEQLYTALMAKREALYAFATLGGINKTIAAAKSDATTNEEKARTSLLHVIDQCAQARILMAPFEQLDAGMDALEKDIETFLASHAQREFVKGAVEKLAQDIGATRFEARQTGDHAKAAKKLKTADAAFLALRRAADAHIPYVARKGEVEVELAKMEKDTNRYAIVADIASVRKDLGAAADKATAHDHKSAMPLLAQAADTARDALLKAKMNDKAVAPTVAEVKKILEGKDGAKRLDAIIATLDPQAKRKVLDVAFAARFDCQLTRFTNTDAESSNTEDVDKDKKAPDVRRFYDLMCELPETHTKDNDSMQVFLVGGPVAQGSDYWGSKKRVAMREGDVATSGIYGVALPHEIEEVEPGCEIDKGEPITFFNWNTVHEVGHAVDDKLGFMKGKGKAYASWTEYGSNVRPIAEAVAGKYSFDVGYVANYMITGTAVASAKTEADADPTDVAKATALATAQATADNAVKGLPPPKDCEPDEWERRRVACIAWVDSARAGKNPWSSASAAKALEIGGIVYHESYDSGSWSSYKLSARKQGVSGYQFRAPGEWFSELYAAFHTKKMKSSHPAYSWLQTL